MYAVTGAPPIVVFGANGSLGIGGGHTAAGPSAPRATATIPTTVSSDISLVETLFFPTVYARSGARPSHGDSVRTGDTPVAFVAHNANPANAAPPDVGSLIDAVVGIFISNGDEPGEDGGLPT